MCLVELSEGILVALEPPTAASVRDRQGVQGHLRAGAQRIPRLDERAGADASPGTALEDFRGDDPVAGDWVHPLQRDVAGVGL